MKSTAGFALCAAAPGSATAGSPGLPSATATRRSTLTPSSVSGPAPVPIKPSLGDERSKRRSAARDERNDKWSEASKFFLKYSVRDCLLSYGIRIFPYATSEMASALNPFLRTQRVVRLTRQWCDAGPESSWAFCIEYVEGAIASGVVVGATAKVDYREILEPQQFDVYAQLRTLRKTLTLNRPLCAIFTNPQLAACNTRQR